MGIEIPPQARDYIKKNFKKLNVVCLSGAGISAESGVPVFRGRGGLWEKYDPEIYANTEGLISILRTQPDALANFIIDFYSILLKARPNPAHIALSLLEKEGILTSVITQNIDNLHRQAGSRSVIELHGNAFRIKCPGCQRKIILERERIRELIQLLKINQDSHLKILKLLSRYFPRCNCGSRYRIDIVLFGEMLPQDELSHAFRQLDKCNVLLVIGCSLAVYPAASLPLYAKEKGAKLIGINSDSSAILELCDYKINGKASEVMTEILRILEN